MAEEIKGILLSPARIGYILSVLSAVGLFYSIITYANARDYQIQSNTSRIEKIEKLAENVQSLELKVTELVTIIKETRNAQLEPYSRSLGTAQK